MHPIHSMSRIAFTSFKYGIIQTRMHFDIPYGDHPRQKIDLYRPDDGEPKALIVYLYGGGWRDGSRGLYRMLGRTFESSGYAVAIPDYRTYPEVKYPFFMEDAALALAWLEANASNYQLPDRPMILIGHSAGAHMAALLLTNTRFLTEQQFDQARISGFVGLAGPYAFNPLEFDTTVDVFKSAMPIEDAMPIKNVSGAEPPMLLLHGEDDTTVYTRNTKEMTAAVNTAGGSAQNIIYDGIGHTGILFAMHPLLRWRAPVFQDILTFLNKLHETD